MKPVSFSIVSGIVTLLYSTACFAFFKQPFWGFTALCVGALVTFYPLYFERQRVEAMRDAQVAQYLKDTLPSGRNNSIYGSKMREIRETLEAIERGRLRLSDSELSEFTEHRIAEKIASGQPTRYWVTHLVDSQHSCGIWGRAHSTYPWHRSYTDRQRILLEFGGELIRLFIFDPTWLKNNLEACRDMIEHHEALFAPNPKRDRMVTLATVPVRGEPLNRQELSIVDGEEVFLWARNNNPDYGEYIVNPDEVAELVSRWERYRDNAYTPEEFFRLVEEGLL